MMNKMGLLLLALASTTTMMAQTTAKGLKNAFKKDFMVGVAVNQRNVSNAEQQAMVCREFNSVTAENDMKPASTEPREDQWNWGGADRIADFCRQNGLKMRGHCLVWHNQIGRWMYTNEDGSLASKEELFARMRKHIHTIVNRYKDVVYCWDVVNEAITDDPRAENPYRQSPLYKIAGEEFIEKAFIYAREADPNVLLFYNDYNEADPVKSERIYQMVKQMKERGIPIDGIGMQGHYNIYGPSAEEVERAIEKYQQVVGHIHVTELDIRANREMGGGLDFSREGTALTDSIDQAHARRYAELFRVFRRHSAVIDCVTFWNLGDRDSWLGAKNYPLLFDEQYLPKPSYDAVMKVAKEKIKRRRK